MAWRHDVSHVTWWLNMYSHAYIREYAGLPFRNFGKNRDMYATYKLVIICDMTTMSLHDVMTLITWHDDAIQPYCISMRILESAQDFYLKFYGKIEISILPMKIINFPFVWCCDVMTSCHDGTKPDLPISACRCARKLILFLLPWFCRSLISKMLLDFHLCDAVTSWRHVMTSLNPDLSVSACRCARKLILFLFPWFLGHWFQKCC